MTQSSNYGRYYWCIKVPQKVSKSGEIYGCADEVEVTATGVLLLWQVRDGEPRRINLAFAPSQWNLIYAASCVDGSPVAVDHWVGEVSEQLD
jgi:hypothetical protein